MKRPFYTQLSFDSVTSAEEHDGVFTISRDDAAVDLPLETAAAVTAETLRWLLDESRLQNHRGEPLASFLGKADEMEFRRILDRIAGPDRPNFTTC